MEDDLLIWVVMSNPESCRKRRIYGPFVGFNSAYEWSKAHKIGDDFVISVLASPEKVEVEHA